MGTEKRERQKANRAQKLASQAVVEKQEQRRRGIVGLIVVVVAVIVIGGILVLSKSGDDKKDTATASSTTTASTTTTPAELKATPFVYGTSACPPTDDTAVKTITFKSPPKNCLDPDKSYTATFDTTAGKIVVDLDVAKTPGTTNNFVFLARNKYYDDTKIFRADTSIDILQGGSPHTQDASDPGPGYQLPDEGKFDAGATQGEYRYTAGDLVMARSTGPDGASAQFFFVTGPKAANLDSQGVYVVFGHVTEGLDILQKMVTTSKDSGDQLGGAPNPPVTITTVSITEQ